MPSPRLTRAAMVASSVTVASTCFMALWVVSMMALVFLNRSATSSGGALAMVAQSFTSGAPRLPKEMARYLLPSNPSVSMAARESVFTSLEVERSRDRVTDTLPRGDSGSRISSMVPLRSPPMRTSAPFSRPETVANSVRRW